MDVARQRLANQRLIGEPFRTPLEVVSTMGAVQAQDYAGAKWGIAQRTDGATDADIEQLVIDGAIVRTHVLRPTWHFVAAPDVRWMLALTGARVSAAMGSHNRKLGLTPAVFKKSHDTIARALEGGKHLTRAELSAVLQRARLGDCTGQRLGHLMMQAELDAVICSGARRGKQFTYALLDERATPTKPRDRDEALAELATRYFSTRSPATAQDFAWWSGLTVGDAKRGMDAAGHPERSEGSAFPARARSTHLLPNYDEFFIGYRDRSAILALVKDAKPMARDTALFAHVIEIDGQLVGGWKRAGDRVETTYLARVSAAKRAAVQAQAKRYLAFVL